MWNLRDAKNLPCYNDVVDFEAGRFIRNTEILMSQKWHFIFNSDEEIFWYQAIVFDYS